MVIRESSVTEKGKEMGVGRKGHGGDEERAQDSYRLRASGAQRPRLPEASKKP